MAQWKKVACFFLYHADSQVHIYKRWQHKNHYGKQASQQTQSEVLAIFSWETSGPAIRMDLALSSATYLNFFLHIPSC